MEIECLKILKMSAAMRFKKCKIQFLNFVLLMNLVYCERNDDFEFVHAE